jgi:hypothetical protein
MGTGNDEEDASVTVPAEDGDIRDERLALGCPQFRMREGFELGAGRGGFGTEPAPGRHVVGREPVAHGGPSRVGYLRIQIAIQKRIVKR